MSTKQSNKQGGTPAVVLQRLVLRLREQLAAMVRRADYVCAHRYGHDAPTGTRIIAVEDLRSETARAKRLLQENNKVSE
jgi:hypothetical protein